MCGGLAGCAAVTICMSSCPPCIFWQPSLGHLPYKLTDSAANMPEVMKTRLQLQGELQKADSNAPRVYKNVFDVFAKTWRMEGLRGLQRGLLPAVRCC
jgi:solute carrier family 25 protein 34/35